MRVIPPLEITVDRLTNSSVPQPASGETVWATETEYLPGALVIRTGTRRTYRCLVNAFNQVPETSPTYWEDAGPTRRWAMFDTLRNTATYGTSPVTVVITPGVRVDSLALLGLDCTAVRVQATSGGSPVYDTGTIDMLDRDTSGWHAYFFGAFRNRSGLVLFDLPAFANLVITLTLTNSGGTASCGACVIGTYVYLGSAEFNATSDVVNFSSVERDEDGNATMTRRRNVPVTKQRLWTEKSLVDTVRRIRDELNGTNAVWSTLDGEDQSDYFQAMLILGFPRRFSINLAYPTQALIDLELEEV